MKLKQRKEAPWFYPAEGRTQVEMDSIEYERMRDALGADWEWRGMVQIRDGDGLMSFANLRDEARRCICDGFKSDGTCRHTRESGVLPENTESAWLIEQSGNAIRYATVEDGMFAWTPDVSEAIRFSRRDDAEMYAELIGDDDVHIREHVWTDTPKRITEQHTPKRIVSDLPTGESEEPKS